MGIGWDLSWFFGILPTIVQNLANFLSSLSPSLEGIINTGQGLFAGLSTLGSAIWDAILKGIESFGKWLYNTFKWIYDGIVYWASVFGEWISYAFQWVGSGLNWIAQQVYNFGNWLYNSLVYIWNWLVNAIKGVWTAICNFFSGIATAIGTWWNNVTSGINSWFTSLVTGIRNKLVENIMADVGIYFGWKSIDRLINAKSVKDAIFSILGLVCSPLVAYVYGNIINGLVPTPSTTPIQLIPSIPMFSYTPPSLEVETPTEKPYPEIGTPPSAPPRATERGLPYDVTAQMILTYDSTTLSRDKSASISSTFEYEVT
jgi:phage-related protein